jgi:hypothetical protein
MAVREARFPVPGRPVTMTNGERTLEFDSPADIVDYLAENPDLYLDIQNWEWTSGLVVSDN